MVVVDVVEESVAFEFEEASATSKMRLAPPSSLLPFILLLLCEGRKCAGFSRSLFLSVCRSSPPPLRARGRSSPTTELTCSPASEFFLT